MKYALALAACLAATGASAQSLGGGSCVQWGVDMLGNRVCMASDLLNCNPVVPITSPSVGTLSGAPAKCPEGFSLVYADRLMCAKDLREPEYK